MASKLRAGGSFPYVLESCRDGIAEPQFMLRVLSGVADDEVRDLRLKFVNELNHVARRELLEQMLSMVVVSVVDPEFKDKPLRATMTDRECFELLDGARDGAVLTIDEIKKFASPPKSEAAICATDAVPSVPAE